jgi:phosphate transport system substrate-binding protein
VKSIRSGRRTAYLALPLAAALLLGACGGDDSSSDDSSSDDDLSGSLQVSGSSTVEPITSLVGEAFAEENSGVEIVVEGPGTGDGFQKFCAGETDISDASRPIKDEEAALCEEGGIEYVEIPVAFDALSVVTNSANDAVECLTLEDLYGLVGPESEAETWAEAAEWGATSDLPDAPLEIFAPGQESGTYDSFAELALADVAEARGYEGEEVTRTFPGLADDNQIISGIQGSDTSFGWVGFAFADQADVKKLEIDGGEGCVAPSAETVEDGTYPLSRTLYIYVKTNDLAENAALRAFVDFYLAEGSTFVEEADYINLDEATATQASDAWAAATEAAGS